MLRHGAKYREISPNRGFVAFVQTSGRKQNSMTKKNIRRHFLAMMRQTVRSIPIGSLYHSYNALPESRVDADADRHRPRGPLHVRCSRGFEVKANCLDVNGRPEASRIRQWVAQSMSHFVHASAFRIDVYVRRRPGRRRKDGAGRCAAIGMCSVMQKWGGANPRPLLYRLAR